MKKETLQLIHSQARICASSIKEFGHDRKYEWKLWGYLECLWNLGYINYEEKHKIKQHYRKYFNGLKASRN